MGKQTGSSKKSCCNRSIQMPPFFQELMTWGCISLEDVLDTSDGFYAVRKSLSDILAEKGITTFPDSEGQSLPCNLFFDDWYFYAVAANGSFIYSLFKMREQEHDAKNGVSADGDAPGVTISFIALDTDIPERCLNDPTDGNRGALRQEVNRIVAERKQPYHRVLKMYFCRAESLGPYLIAELYVRFLSELALNGQLDVPEAYASIYRKAQGSGFSRLYTRIPRFLDTNNAAAGYTECDHEKIYLRDPANLSSFEKNALLATHTADVSVHSFAAEVRYHARFLAWYAKLRIPFLGRSVYDSAIRADMSIDETALEEFAPFHHVKSPCVRKQETLHRPF